MKKNIILLIIVRCAPLFAADLAIEPLVIETKILHTVDGNQRFIKMDEFINFQHHISSCLHAKMESRNRQKECSFKTLVALENKLNSKERDHILQRFIHQFAQAMQHNIFEELKLIQSEVNHIITDWAILRDRPDTLIRIFSSKEYQINREEGLKKYVTTLVEFDSLLEDLHLFFTDLIHSLPKSFHKYQEALKEHQHDATTSHHDGTGSTVEN